MKNPIQHIAIVGSGLVGSMMASFLAKHNYRVSVFERRADLRKSENNIGGRSINLALSNRGWLPLQRLGLEEQIKEMVIPMHRRVMHDKKQNLSFQNYGKDGEYINSISRGGLNHLLMDFAEQNGAEFFFNHKCHSIDFEHNSVSFEIEGAIKLKTFDLIIGTDGAFSSIRNGLQKTDRFNFQQHYIEHGYKELCIPPGDKNNPFQIEKNALHIWPRKSFMLIALPNLDGSFTVTLFLPFEGEHSFEKLQSKKEIESFFKEEFPDALALIPNLVEEFDANPTSSLVTVKCYPWIKNNCLIMGDAAHAIVPFYGQGMNAGFEDCRILEELIVEHNHNWDAILPSFQKMRKPDADAIADLAMYNFIEMRDSVADPRFLLRKKIESLLHEKFPKEWVPLYSMVTFSEHIPYAQAMKIGQVQRNVMDQVMQNIHQEEDIKNLSLENIIKDKKALL